jgi:hypothetical protein
MPMNITRSYISVEARSAATLQLKVISKQATGWVVDGPALEVTDYSHGKRAVTRYSQGMYKNQLSFNWDFAR